METIREIDVTRLDDAHRRALEDVIGIQLKQNQRLIIHVTEVVLSPESGSPRRAQSIRDWTDVYDQLSDAEVEAIDREVKTRADLTRDLS